MAAKPRFTGKTPNPNGPAGGARSSDGRLDIKLLEPHPAAEQPFGPAWSACYMGAIGLAIAQRKEVKLPAGLAVDAEIDSNQANGAFFHCTRRNVSVPGFEREQAPAKIPRTLFVRTPRPSVAA